MGSRPNDGLKICFRNKALIGLGCLKVCLVLNSHGCRRMPNEILTTGEKTPGFDSQKFTQDDVGLLRVFLILHAFQVRYFRDLVYWKACLVTWTAILFFVYCLQNVYGLPTLIDCNLSFGRIRRSDQLVSSQAFSAGWTNLLSSTTGKKALWNREHRPYFEGTKNNLKWVKYWAGLVREERTTNDQIVSSPVPKKGHELQIITHF